MIRILLAADPEEVLTAMEALGIQLVDIPGFLDIVVALLSAFIAPLGVIFSFLEEAAVLLDFAAAQFRNPGLRNGFTPEDAERLAKKARMLRLQGISERDKFREGIEEAAEEAPPEGFTFTI